MMWLANFSRSVDETIFPARALSKIAAIPVSLAKSSNQRRGNLQAARHFA
jgi:hypothetical protein